MTDERYFRVTLSEESHRVVLMALKMLNAGDEESAAENEGTIQEFINTTEEVR